MRIRLADYVANFLVEHGVTDVFSVVGGGAMHLNDALGHNEKLKVTYNHHEQACAIAAEAYARIDNRIAAVCVMATLETALFRVPQAVCYHTPIGKVIAFLKRHILKVKIGRASCRERV